MFEELIIPKNCLVALSSKKELQLKCISKNKKEFDIRVDSLYWNTASAKEKHFTIQEFMKDYNVVFFKLNKLKWK